MCSYTVIIIVSDYWGIISRQSEKIIHIQMNPKASRGLKEILLGKE